MDVGEARTAHVAVLGLGPAGRSLTQRLAAWGVDVVAIDPDPGRPWQPTYAAWADELPSWLPREVVATSTPAYAWARHGHALGRAYAVLDTLGLQRTLATEQARVLTGTVAAADAHRVTLTDGRAVRAEIVLDARGTRPAPGRAQQTAVGVVVRKARATSFDRTWFMDWRTDNSTDDDAPSSATPSFLYVVPLDEERLLLEETCLVGRPALGEKELRRRLLARLQRRGVRLTGDERTEVVRFSVEPEPAAASGQLLRVGARGGLMHPATGYSVATSLVLAEELSRAIVLGATTRPALERVLWGRAARQVRTLREIGLTTLLRLPPDGVLDFFEAFFSLPVPLQRAYLSDRTRPQATVTAMAAMATRMPSSLSRIAVTSALGSTVRGRSGLRPSRG